MINSFQALGNKLNWPLAIQLERLISTLQLVFRQFVVSHQYNTFKQVGDSITLYQNMIEVEQV